ncbi:hypothetical protein NF867_07875 [Solitalea sp. MAHUQ-68]|uniref:Uncharacterized protein n=1 Tax=Solitalea agri TaxID=2953739 RepID=A0A9X2F216_9SPHI|nr:hypothetical protein [Solitalea agri]MCO4292776.1 hypothetical protein [Solitalea agri]
MKIVILGASGQIGSLIFEKLKVDFDVMGTARRGTDVLYQFDPFTDDWEKLGKCDVLINCIGQIEEKRSSSFLRIHYDLINIIIKNRELIGNPRIIQLSALGASTNHTIEFFRTKGLADDYLIQLDNTVIVRPSIVCTHLTTLVRKLKILQAIARVTNGLLVLPRGFKEHLIQPIIPSDLAELVKQLCAIKELPQLVDAVGPDRIAFNTLISIALKNKIRMVEVPKLVFDGLVNGIIARVFPKLINKQEYQLLFTDNLANPTGIQELLNKPLSSTLNFWETELN